MFEPNPRSRKEGKVLLEQCIIDCVNTYMYKRSVWGEDYAFVNFSEIEGNGIMLIPMNCYGIIATSRQKKSKNIKKQLHFVIFSVIINLWLGKQ